MSHTEIGHGTELAHWPQFVSLCSAYQLPSVQVSFGHIMLYNKPFPNSVVYNKKHFFSYSQVRRSTQGALPTS